MPVDRRSAARARRRPSARPAAPNARPVRPRVVRPTSPPALSHLDDHGDARMVDVGAKPITARQATARVRLRMSSAALRALRGGVLPKGDALTVARLAGIQAAKRTAEWIPLCHPLPLDHVGVTIDVEEGTSAAVIHATVRAQARTGVEMEALVAAAAAALALYDMLKGIDRALVIEELLVVKKEGGKTGTFRHPRAKATGQSR